MKNGLNILGYDYSLDISKTIEQLDGNVGYTNFDLKSLEVAVDVDREVRNSTLLHEIMEAINYHLEVGMTEAQIKQLEVGLHQVFKDSKINLDLLSHKPEEIDDRITGKYS